MKIEEYIEATNNAETPEELFKIFLGELECLGLDRVIYSYMTDSPFLKKNAQHGVVRNYPDDWMKYYGENNYITYDPVYRAAFISRKPFTWNELERKNELKPKQAQVMREAREAGLRDGIAMSIQGPSGEIVGIGMASSMGGVDSCKNALSKIYMLVNQFHFCHSDMVMEDVPLAINCAQQLTPRERDVLLWCGQNKSSSDIATILNISEKTVEFHLAKIYKKLGVNGKILAVLKASHLGMIRL